LIMAGTAAVVVKEVKAYSTSYHGRSLEQWLAELDDQKPGPAFDRAADAVRHIGKNGVPIIIAKLRAKGPVDHRVIVACYVLGPDAEPAIPDLVRIINRGFIQGYVGAALGQIGPAGVAPLAELSTNRNDGIRSEAVSALGNMYYVPANHNALRTVAVPVLISRLKDSSPYVRYSAAMALGQIAEDETAAVPALIPVLQDPDSQTRWCACLGIGKFGSAAKAAVPALSAALNDKATDVRHTAAIALVEIDPENIEQLNSLMPILIENINGIGGRNFNFRSTTAEALAMCGSKAGAAVPALLKAVENTSDIEQQRIIDSLKKIDPVAATNAGLK
ncbi:MAG TPA: sister chromatid cohesion protein PDS5, partial [Desulfuromonadaceae bacterium]|nr:sister chromatid cohesion protein PDS5 [Desulfuromonadaceae bacterium]